MFLSDSVPVTLFPENVKPPVLFVIVAEPLILLLTTATPPLLLLIVTAPLIVLVAKLRPPVLFATLTEDESLSPVKTTPPLLPEIETEPLTVAFTRLTPAVLPDRLTEPEILFAAQVPGAPPISTAPVEPLTLIEPLRLAPHRVSDLAPLALIGPETAPPLIQSEPPLWTVTGRLSSRRSRRSRTGRS